MGSEPGPRRAARPTIRDVAALAGVSTATVSYVLNGTGSVSEATAARVRACVEDLGYRADSLAVAHRTGRSGTIGVAVADLSNPFCPDFARGVHRAAVAHGLRVFLLDAQGSVDDEYRGIEMVGDHHPEGLIWMPVGQDLRSLELLAFPTVTFDIELDGYDSVTADVFRGGALQAECVNRHGHRRIGVVSGPQWSDTGQMRRRGLVRHLAPEVEIVWEFPLGYGADIPIDVGREILAHDVSCVVTANDIQAMGLLRLYRDAGWRVPDDVSVIGFDDISMAELVDPPLTTVRLPTVELGMTAVEVLVERIDEPDRAVRRERLGVSMADRASVRCVGQPLAGPTEAPAEGSTAHSVG